MLRTLTPSDLELICSHRHRMFLEAGHAESVLEQMAAPFREWLLPRLADGRYFGFIAQSGSAPIGGVGLMQIEWPPHPLHPRQDRRGYVLNLYVVPEHRRRGVARELMRAAETEFRRLDLQFAVLHATEAARELYAALGWSATREMARIIPEWAAMSNS